MPEMRARTVFMEGGKVLKRGDVFTVDELRAAKLRKRKHAVDVAPAPAVEPAAEAPKPKRAYKRRDMQAESVAVLTPESASHGATDFKEPPLNAWPYPRTPLRDESDNGKE